MNTKEEAKSNQQVTAVNKTNKANQEQLMAIEHQGGVLLSAGAGSGKTYVLVEHIIYKIKCFIQDPEGQTKNASIFEEEKFLSLLRQYLGGIVVMTFTRKAVGELHVRLRRRIEEEVKSNSDSINATKWKLVQESINVLTVCTIHSFCYRLLKQGIFLEVNPRQEVITPVQGRSKLELILRQWFSLVISSEGKTSIRPAVLETLSLNYKRLLDSLWEIFNDPNLRLTWKNFNLNELDDSKLSGFFSELKLHYPFQMILDEEVILDLNDPTFEKYRRLKWYQFLIEFNQVKKSKNFAEIWKFFNDCKRMPPGPKINEKSEKLTSLQLDTFNLGVEYWSQIKNLRKFISDNENSFAAFFELVDKDFKYFLSIILELINFIESRYFEFPGMTFSDLEYYVLLGLQNGDIVKRISSAYNYFIVDEFQDVSNAQFDLITGLLNKDFNRLFAVGDIKQAIYGFRGGELQVFLTAASKVNRNLELKNNYRSNSNIVTFNNIFFNYIFKKGINFESVDAAPVPMTYQVAANHSAASSFSKNTNVSSVSSLVKIKCNWVEKEKWHSITSNLPEEKIKLSSSAVNELEAKIIGKYISKLQKDDPELKTVAILYKNLTPVKYLLPELRNEEISFVAQIKLSYADDPLVGIFYVLLEYYIEQGQIINKSSRLAYAQMIIDGYLKFWEISSISADNLASATNTFFADIEFYGLLYSFTKFIFALKIANSNYKNNLDYITNICHLSAGDIHAVWSNLKTYTSSKYSINYQHGVNPKVVIMSAHSAKGLEFPHVILAGIHTNGRQKVEANFLGDLPGSIRWCPETGDHQLLKSPYYLLEGVINKNKDFAESKRLFYVACTRAKNSLSYVDLSLPHPQLFISPKNSWIRGFEAFYNELKIDPMIMADFNSEQCLVNLELAELLKNNTGMGEGQFQINQTAPTLLGTAGQGVDIRPKDPNRFRFINGESLGIIAKRGTEINSLGIISELSVTKLASLAECPRKFYIQNVCKIEEEDLLVLKPIMQKKSVSSYSFATESTVSSTSTHTPNSTSILTSSTYSTPASPSTPISTSCSTSIDSLSDASRSEDSKEFIHATERGQLTHLILSEIIKGSKKQSELSERERNLLAPMLKWIGPQIDLMSQHYNLISEQLIKFSLAGYMITGIPDLRFKPKESELNSQNVADSSIITPSTTINSATIHSATIQHPGPSLHPYTVWDFKTGTQDANRERGYWFQLNCYGYASYQLKECPLEADIELCLIYLDQELMIKRRTNYKEISLFIENEWKSLDKLNEKNKTFCNFCEYQCLGIC